MIAFTMARPETYTVSLDIPASPEPVKYPLALVDGNSRTMVGNIHAPIREHLHRHLFAQGRMGNRIFDKVSDCVFDRVSVSVHTDRSVESQPAKRSAPSV